MCQTNVTRVDKPWGYELHWAKTDRYVGKLIHVNAGHALSLQYHNQKDETIFLWAGRHAVRDPGRGQLVKREMKLGEAVHVTPGTVHRMTAIADCDIFEVSTPELHDVVRLEDDTAGPDVVAESADAVALGMRVSARGCCVDADCVRGCEASRLTEFATCQQWRHS